MRESAIGLMNDLLLVIDKDMRKDEFTYITIEEKYKILSTLYIMRYDNKDSIRTIDRKSVV